MCIAIDSGEVQDIWYAFRCWIEKGFRDLKRGGLQWQRTRLEDPRRVERYWCVLSLSDVYLLEVSGSRPLLELQGRRKLSYLKWGWFELLTNLIQNHPVPLRPVSLIL